MSLWNAPSDRDYDDEVQARLEPLEYDVACVSCSRHFYVRADEPPPYRCEACCEDAIIVAEIDAARRIA